MVSFHLQREYEGKRRVLVVIRYGYPYRYFETSSSWLEGLHEVLDSGVQGSCYRMLGNTLQVEDDESWYNEIEFSEDGSTKEAFKDQVKTAINEASLLFDKKDHYGYYIEA